jgi:hypothetical protein
MGYRLLVGVILVVHFAFVVYVVFGGLPAIRWPRLFWPHLAAAGWGLLVISRPVVCPLTRAEDWARRRAGEAALTRGFIDLYIEGVLYPARYTHVLWVLAGLVIVCSWLVAYRRWRSGRRARGEPAGSAERTRRAVAGVRGRSSIR